MGAIGAGGKYRRCGRYANRGANAVFFATALHCTEEAAVERSVGCLGRLFFPKCLGGRGSGRHLRVFFEAFDLVVEVLYPRGERGRGLFQKREREFVVLEGFWGER